MDIEGVGIVGRGLTATGPLGSVFENIDLRVDPGSLAIVSGAAGSGRTSMLLALSGRLRLIAGHLKVSGLVLPYRARTVRKLVVPARFSPGFDLEPQHRVHQVIRERRAISKVSRDAIDDALGLVGAEVRSSQLVGDLHPAERLLLAVALAAAEQPAGMLVDDVDHGLPAASRERAWSALHEVAATGTTVLASATEPPPDGDVKLIRLSPESPEANETTSPLPPTTRILPRPHDQDEDAG